MNEYNNIFIGIIIVIIIILIYEITIHIQVNKIKTIHEPLIKDINNISNVPNIIHRTWYSKSLHKKMYDLAYYSWLKLNPTYKMIWNDDNDCEISMKEYGLKEYLAWKRIIPTAYKADLWRAIVLYKYGGVYVDSYAVAVKSIDDIILKSNMQNEKNIFISVLDAEGFGSGIHNGLIICTPKHPLLLQYINDMLDNIKIGKEDTIMALTGPICLSRSINRYLNRDINIKHKLGLNNVNGIKYYLMEFHWGPSGFITIDNNIMLYKKYDIIDCWLYQKVYKSLISSNHSYLAMNRIGTIVND